MSQFSLEQALSSISKMDAPIKGPVPRWQRKAMENSQHSSSALCMSSSLLNASSCNTSVVAGNTSTAKTPSKTPSKTPKSRGSSKKGAKTPSGGNDGDRFIANRSAMQFDLANYVLTQQSQQPNKTGNENDEYRQAVSEQLNTDLSNFRVLAYRQMKAPVAFDGNGANRVLYSSSKTLSSKKSTRYVPSVADRILDAPSIVDDYYLNLIDWSAQNILAVGLAGHVFMWNETTGDVQHLLELENNDYICSLSFTADGCYLAIGTSSNEVQLWDVGEGRRLRMLNGHTNRVSSLSWREHVLSSGARSGKIHHSDVRVQQHNVGVLDAHAEEICGLKWSPDGRYLASGGNDNLLQVWPNTLGSGVRPVHSFTEHMAAVKAVSWCPWQPSLLASGGGTADRCLRLWNCNMGTAVNSVETGSQICGVLWSEEFRELVTGHGYSKNELIIWKYPTLSCVAELTGHTQRILNLAMNPTGVVVCSASADESLRLWNCFEPDQTRSNVKKHASKSAASTAGSSSSASATANAIARLNSIR